MRRCLDEDRPVLMVASGSGIAPFRGLWQEMMFRKVSPSKTLLIFGCRDDDEDLFRGETALAIRRVAAFSRKAGTPRMYAQDKLEEMFQDVVDIVFKQGGSMLVCGSVS